MSIAHSLIAFGLRQVIESEVGQLIERVEAHFADHSRTLPKALTRANDLAWQAVGLALGGGGFVGRIKGWFASADLKAARDYLREFLERTPTGWEDTPADLRSRCLDEWHRLYQAGRFGDPLRSGTEIAYRAGEFQRFADPAGLAREAQRAVARIADDLRADAPHLASVLGRAPAEGGPPLLVGVFLFFFHRQIEEDQALAHGLTFATLRNLSADLARGLGALDQAFAALGERVHLLFDMLQSFFREVASQLADIQDKLDRLAEQNNVRTSPAGPLNVSVNDAREREQLRRLRDRLRELPPELVGADDWMLLGDGLAAAGEFAEARASHQQAAAAARAAADRRREAEGHCKDYRDACEQKNWIDALASLNRAVDLDPQRFRPFDTRRYEILAILGVGGFGTVFHCRDRHRRNRQGERVEVAIKTLHTADLARDLDEVFAEAHLLNQLEHPGIIRVLDQNFADTEGQQRPYLVLEYFAGPTLEAYLREKGPLRLGDLVAVARQVAAAVHAAHQDRVFHRDLKPANVLVRRAGDGTWQVKVIDFGLAVRETAAVQASSVLTGGRGALRDQSFAGTLDYAAPEQRGKREAQGMSVGPYSDVYGFGKTCLDALFGSTEVVSDYWDELNDPRRDAVRKLVEKCIVPDPRRRFQTFEPVLAELDKLAQQAPPPAKRKPGDLFLVRIPVPDPDRQPGHLLSLRIPIPHPERQPGQLLTLKVTLPDPARKAGELTALRWNPVPARPNPQVKK
jgi:serine/threonine protein kinase